MKQFFKWIGVGLLAISAIAFARIDGIGGPVILPGGVWVDGVYYSQPPTPPSVNGSLCFFGETSPDGGVFVPLAGNPINVGADDFTVDFWFRPSSSGNTQSGGGTDGNILIDRDRLSPNVGGFGISLDAGRISLWLDRPGGGTSSIVTSGTTDLRDDAWHHGRMSRDQSSGVIAVWVDGDLEINQTGPVGGSVEYAFISGEGEFDSDLTYGIEKAGFIGYSYIGCMTEVAWFDVLLYDPGGGVPSTITVPTTRWASDASNLVALHRMDEGEGTAVADSVSGNESPGTLSAGGTGPTWSTDGPF